MMKGLESLKRIIVIYEVKKRVEVHRKGPKSFTVTDNCGFLKESASG